jgi:hypothetical protein
MPKSDFEIYWLGKFASCVERYADVETRIKVMGDALYNDDAIEWSVGAMERLNAALDERTARLIMAGCGCEYPKDQLQEIKQVYSKTKDLAKAHAMLQAQVDVFLRDVMKFSEPVMKEIKARGWGAAGVLNGREIISTKIPKSGNLLAYLDEPDTEKCRQLYCHCPRVRDILSAEKTISPIYCYCGAGYYKAIWEEITGRDVEVEVLKSVLNGDDVCSIRITISD